MEFFESIFSEPWRLGLSIFASAATILSVGIGIGAWFGTHYLRPKYRESLETIKEIRRGLEDDTFIWLQEPIRRPTRPTSRIPILTVANLKGGVGKSTLVANLAAHLDRHKLRVLVIDLDYQGSLSATMAWAAGIGTAPREIAVKFLSNSSRPSDLVESPESLHPVLPNTRIVTATDDLAIHESKLMLDWFVERKRKEIDARYSLRHYLCSAPFQNSFDVILIDTPPRLTTGFINALCASTHLFVPTAFTGISAIAVARFLKQVDGMKQHIFPGLKTVGVVGQMLATSTGLSPQEKSAVEAIRLGLMHAGLSDVDVLEKQSIPRRSALQRPGVAYLVDREVQSFFDSLGAEVRRRIGL